MNACKFIQVTISTLLFTFHTQKTSKTDNKMKAYYDYNVLVFPRQKSVNNIDP